MQNPPTKTLFSISEVASLISEAPSLIRFWEKEFKQIKPYKSEKGTRKYTEKDIQIIKLIHHLVKEKGMTLEGAKAYLKTQPHIEPQAVLLEKLTNLKAFLKELKNALPK